MKKKFLLLLTCMVCSLASLSAQTALVVMQKSGGSVYYSFEDNPKVMFSGENVVISTSKTVVEYPLANLFCFSFDSMANGVLDIKSDGTKVQLSENKLVVTGLATEEVVSVYDIQGRKHTSGKAENGIVSLSLENSPSGVYIIKSNNVSYKITKK